MPCALLAATIYKARATASRSGPGGTTSPASSEAGETGAKTSGARTAAAAQLDKVLALDPGHFAARRVRMMQLLQEGRIKEAESDLELVLNHPDLAKHLKNDPDEEFEFFRLAARRFARDGFFDDALQISEKMVFLSRKYELHRGRALFAGATILAMGAQEDPGRLERAVYLLQKAFQANVRYWEWYQEETAFDRVRSLIDQMIARSWDSIWTD